MKKSIKLLFTLIILIIFSNVYALGSYNDGTDRSSMSNYGVNKHWTINSSNLDNVLRTPKVDASAKVYDYANIISEEEENQIRALIDEYIIKTRMDVVFLTIDMPYSSDKQNEDYAADFYDYNDFGLDFDKYSGIVLLRNNYSADRYYDIYMFGDAQLYFVGDRADYILDDLYPYFSTGQYFDGFKNFMDNINYFYNQGKYLDDYYVDDDGYLHKDKGAFQMPLLPMVLFGGLSSGIAVSSMKKKNKMVKPAYTASEYLNKSAINYKTKVDQFLTTHTTSHYISHDSGGSGGGGGFHSSGGSSGGGHSSGGGRHG